MRKWLKDKVEKLYGDNSKEDEKLSETEIEQRKTKYVQDIV